MHDLSALESNEQYEDTELPLRDGENEDPEVDEAQELESAAQLLAINSEAELDHFLGGLIRAAKAVGRRLDAATGGTLRKTLKGLARQALPMVATAVGGPGGGLAASGSLEPALKAFGLELEGLSEEDQELELTRRFVRIANATVHRLMRQRPGEPRARVRSALRWAMGRYAPGLWRSLTERSARFARWRARYRGHRGNYGLHGYPGYLDDPGAGNPGDPGAFPAYPGAVAGAPTPQTCPPCPVCPTCGTGTPDPAPPTVATPSAPNAGSHELEALYEDEDEDEDEGEDEGVPPAPYAAVDGNTGQWRRHGNRIVLYGV